MLGLAWVLTGLFGPVADVSLPDPSGRPVRLSTLAAGRPVAVVFLGTGCPLAAKYAPALNTFTDRVGVLGVFSGDESADDVAAFARAHGVRFPVVRDADAGFGDRVRAARTPEVVLLDADRRIRYRGRVDDRYGTGEKDRGRATREDLAEAVADVLAGRPVAVPVTPVAGCAINRPRKKVGPPRVSYARDVAAVLDRRCGSCHVAGGIGPFPLATFAQARAKAAAVAEAVADGRMPPWHASPEYGRFRNDPRLTPAEKERIADWVAAGCPEGDPAERPAPPPTPTGWAVGTPDRVIRFPETYPIPATGDVPYRHVFVDPGFTTDVWLRAVEFRPGNRRVVHHCNVFLHPPHEPETTTLFETGPLESSNLLAYTPGSGPGRYPDGTAKRVPAGWKLHFVIHYTAVGTPQEDRSELGLVFADPATVRQEVATKLIVTEDFVVPPGAAAYRVEQTWTTDRDVLVTAFFPHMHLRGKSFRYTAEYPDGTAEVLLDVPAYDFHWQHRYELADPKRLPAGTAVRCVAIFDNSAANPANPDPAAVVRPGLRSEDEMFNGFLDVVAADEDFVAARSAAAPRRGWVIAAGIVGIGGLGLLARRVAGPGRRATPSPAGSPRTP